MGIPPNNAGIAYMMATSIASMYNISTSRVCNASVSVSLSMFTVIVSFIITDVITVAHNRPGLTTNDNLHHKCIADWIVQDFNIVSSPNDFVAMSSSKPPTCMESFTIEKFTGSPSGSAPSKPEPSKSESSSVSGLYWIIVAIIIVLAIIVAGIWFTLKQRGGNIHSGGRFIIGE